MLHETACLFSIRSRSSRVWLRPPTRGGVRLTLERADVQSEWPVQSVLATGVTAPQLRVPPRVGREMLRLRRSEGEVPGVSVTD